MKKIISILAIIVVLTAFLTSCSKKQVTQESQETQDQESASVPQKEELIQGVESVEDTATELNVDDLDTELSDLEQDLSNW